jgi:hypothetical protein
MGGLLRMLVVSVVGGWLVNKVAERVGGRSRRTPR